MKTVYALLSTVIVTALLALSQPASATEPIYTNKTRFRIPFRFDQAELLKIGAREIRLYVSYDQGATWQHVQSVAPQAGRFDFLAPNNGEFWYCVKTLDAQNQLHPQERTMQAGLKVVVDTQPPQLQLSLREAAPGHAEITWNAADPNLDPTQIRLEYLAPGSPQWAPLQVTGQSQGNLSLPVNQGGMVSVRGLAADRSGNIGHSMQQAMVNPGNGRPSRPPIAGNESNQLTSNQFPELPTPNQFPEIPGPQFNSAPQHNPGLNAPEPRIQPSYASNEPQIDIQPVQQKHDLIPLVPPASPPSRPAASYRMVKQSQFHIDYQIDDVGPSGVGEVELFITQDNGQKWWKYGVDPDRRSPFQVQVPADGTYGFAIRAKNQVGLSASEAPHIGEKPEIVVVVDQTPPTAQLMPIQQGSGTDFNKLLIRWQVRENYPASESVALFYSTSPNGPWNPITTWQKDMGEYLWTVQNGMPNRFYVQLAVRDAAGNVSHVQTNDALVLDFSRPSARIVDVAPENTPTRH